MWWCLAFAKWGKVCPAVSWATLSVGVLRLTSPFQNISNIYIVFYIYSMVVINVIKNIWYFRDSSPFSKEVLKSDVCSGTLGPTKNLIDCERSRLVIWGTAYFPLLGGGFKHFFLEFSWRKLGKISNLTNIVQMGWNHQPDWIVATPPSNSDQKNHHNHRCCCRGGTFYCWRTYGEGGQPKSSPYPYPLSENLSPGGCTLMDDAHSFSFPGASLLSKKKGFVSLAVFQGGRKKSTWNLKITCLEQEKTSSQLFNIGFHGCRCNPSIHSIWPWARRSGQALRTRATFSIISWGEAPGFLGWSRNTTLRRFGVHHKDLVKWENQP